jgi:hypothetical protein
MSEIGCYGFLNCYVLSDRRMKWSKKDGFYTSFQATGGMELGTEKLTFRGHYIPDLYRQTNFCI